KGAEVSGFEGVGWGGVSKARQYTGTEAGPIEVHEEERLVAPVVKLRKDHRPAGGKSEIVVAHRRLAQRLLSKKAAGGENVVGEVLVQASMQGVGSRLGGVLYESAAGVSVLRGVTGGNDFHFLNAVFRRRALMALLVTYRITERSAVKEVLGG